MLDVIGGLCGNKGLTNSVREGRKYTLYYGAYWKIYILNKMGEILFFKDSSGLEIHHGYDRNGVKEVWKKSSKPGEPTFEHGEKPLNWEYEVEQACKED